MNALTECAAVAPTVYYKDDSCVLYHGNCIDLMGSMGAKTVDLILCDPPYGHNNNNNDLAHKREVALGISDTVSEARPIHNDGEEATPLFAEMLAEAKRLLKKGSCCCCCCCCGGGGPDPQFARWSLLLDDIIGFKQMVVWDKGGLGMGWHYRRNYEVVLVGEKPGAAGKWYGGHSVGNVISGIPGIKPSAHDHPTPKPVDLMARFIEWHSQPGDLVLDPFCGSAPVGVAAKRMGRRYIGCDTDERWLQLAAKRLAQGVLL